MSEFAYSRTRMANSEVLSNWTVGVGWMSEAMMATQYQASQIQKIPII